MLDDGSDPLQNAVGHNTQHGVGVHNSRSTPIQGGQVYAPVGLEALQNVGMVFVIQEVELMEVLCGCEGNNRYSIRTGRGQEIMRAIETSGFCSRQCCGRFRPFSMIISDQNGNNIDLKRNCGCRIPWLPCCRNKVTVSMNGQLLGTVQEGCSCCKLNLSINDADGTPVLKITGPCCTTSCFCKDVKFKVVNLEGVEVGQIAKKWSGVIQEAMTDADRFGISFPIDLDEKIKAVLLAACILIDFIYFESEPPKRN